MPLVIPSEAFGGETRLLGENVLKELPNLLDLTPTSVYLRPISTYQICIVILNGYVLQEVLKYFDIFWRLSNLDKWSDKN